MPGAAHASAAHSVWRPAFLCSPVQAATAAMEQASAAKAAGGQGAAPAEALQAEG